MKDTDTISNVQIDVHAIGKEMEKLKDGTLLFACTLPDDNVVNAHIACKEVEDMESLLYSVVDGSEQNILRDAIVNCAMQFIIDDGTQDAIIEYLISTK